MKLIKDLGRRKPKENSSYKKRFGLYECPICLSHFETMTDSVTSGASTQCRSCSNVVASTTHGMRNHPQYQTWSNQKQRCRNENVPLYKNYGGRGISFSSEFEDFLVWLDYIEKLDDYKKKGYTLDRIDNDGNYEIGNLRWASRSTQSSNTRKLRSNNTSGYRGVSETKNGWQSNIGVNNRTIRLGEYQYPWTAAYVYDSYILNNSKEHTMNFVKRKMK